MGQSSALIDLVLTLLYYGAHFVRDYPLEMRTTGRFLAEKAVRNQSKPLIRWQGNDWSYEEIHRLTNRYANGFSRVGIRKGTHVALILGNSLEYFGATWGLGKIGAVSVPLNTAAKGELLRYFIEQSNSEWVIYGEEWEERLGEILHSLEKVKGCQRLGRAGTRGSAIAQQGRDLIDLKSLESETDDDVDHSRVTYQDPHLIMYTSGTTGPSKGVHLPHSQAHAVGRILASEYGYREDDVIYTCLPLFHGNAWNYSCYPALWADATIAVSPRFSVSRFWSEIRQTRATQFNALGAMISMLLKQPEAQEDKSHQVRQCMALPLSRETYRVFKHRYGIDITSLYAMTETFPATLFVPGDSEEKGASAGRASSYTELQILDENDIPLPAGQTGEICVRPREPWIMMLGYYNMPEATAGAMRNMWMHSGDRGYLDEDGYLYFVDRTKETIRRRGENISAYEVEMLAARHPDVREVAAVPVASDLSEDDVMIFVVLRDGADLTHAELIDHCAANMAYFMVPRYVHFVAAIPKTSSEKIEKYKLKQWAADHKAELWDRENEGITIAR
jgi:crotonobetaine/carnitine-CoA ligase